MKKTGTHSFTLECCSFLRQLLKFKGVFRRCFGEEGGWRGQGIQVRTNPLVENRTHSTKTKKVSSRFFPTNVYLNLFWEAFPII